MNKKWIWIIASIGAIAGLALVLFSSKAELPAGDDGSGGKSDGGSKDESNTPTPPVVPKPPERIFYDVRYIAPWPNTNGKQIEVSVPGINNFYISKEEKRDGWGRVTQKKELGTIVKLTNPLYANNDKNYVGSEVLEKWYPEGLDGHGSIRLDIVFKDSIPVEIIPGSTRHGNLKNPGKIEIISFGGSSR